MTPPGAVAPPHAAPPGEAWLTSVACPLCGADRCRPLVIKPSHFRHDGVVRTHPFSVVRCRLCGLDYVSPRLRADLAARNYAEHDLYVDLRGEQLEARRAYFREALAAIERLQREDGRPLPQRGSAPRLLDVACSEGTFVAIAREAGWDAEGIEISAPAAEHGRTVLGLPIRTGTLEEAGLPEGRFQVVTLQSFLEHSEDPLRLLRETFRVLAPGGLLYLNVCNGRSLAARLEKAAWYNYDPVVHLTYFGPRTLGEAARRAGFERVRTRSRGLGARFFQAAVSDTPASRRLDAWYARRGYASPILVRVKRIASAGLSALGLGQTLVLTARKPL